RIGENYTGDHWIIKNCRFEGLVQNDNSACVFLSSSNDTRIENCIMIGTDSTNLNYCGIQIFRGNGSDTIQHCNISHFAEGIFYKHCSLGYMQTVIRNNFIHDNNANGLWISSDHVTMQNNLIVNNVTSGISIWEDAGGTGGSNSSVLHNTVYNQRYTMALNWGGQYDTLTKDHGVRNDTLVNNIFYGNNGELGSYCVWAYAPDSAFADNPPEDSSNYNCYYNTATSNVMRWQGTTYTLANWKIAHSTLDAHSVQGQPTFANTSGTLTTNQDFRLLSGNGYRAASDGMDMGANIDSVGLQGGLNTSISEPAKNNRKFFSQFGTQAHCLILLETHRMALISGEQVFDIRGQQMRNDQVRPNGMYVSMKR
ncbi:MAG: right-handed parallel beta-helix repeat-containing protein, partial [Chitinivibrionales bacterium]